MNNDVIGAQKEAVAEQCRRFGVSRLELFGSAVRHDFDSDRSDFDFIVRFTDTRPGSYADRYLDFADALEALLGRKVDLLTERSIRNPYFREAVNAGRQLVYEA